MLNVVVEKVTGGVGIGTETRFGFKQKRQAVVEADESASHHEVNHGGHGKCQPFEQGMVPIFEPGWVLNC